MVDAKRLQANASATRDGTLPTVAFRAAPLIAIFVIRRFGFVASDSVCVVLAVQELLESLWSDGGCPKFWMG